MRLIDADNALELFRAEYQNTENLIKQGEKQLDSLAEGHTEAAHIIKHISPTVDAVPVVRCMECKFWMPEHIERDDGSIMLYEQLPWMEPGMAPIEFGVNVGSYCTLYENVITHGFRDGKPSLDCTRLWRREDDFCSRGLRRDQSADVRNMGQSSGDGKTSGGTEEEHD